MTLRPERICRIWAQPSLSMPSDIPRRDGLSAIGMIPLKLQEHNA